MPKIRLDSIRVLTLPCEGSRKTDYWDTQIPGFTLEVRVTGGRTYYLRYQNPHGRQRQHKIAGVGDITFDKARKEAQRLRSKVTLHGDPAAEKAQTKAVPTYATLADQHLAHARTYQRSYDTTAMYVKNHLIPRWGKSRLTEIGQQDVAKWLALKREEGLAPATVEKIRAILGRSFELGRQWGVPGCDRPNPARGIPRPPLNNARERFLTAEEAARLREAASASKNSQLRAIIDLLLLTGARVRELLDARWENVDVGRRSWLIPTSKTGKPRRVPLSAAALAVIASLPRFDRCPWLIPNPTTRRPFSDLKHPWQTARAAAGLEGLRIHDLRHSAASFMINSGVDLFTVGKVLGHASVQSSERYAHLANDTLIAAVEAGAAKLHGECASDGL